MTLDDLRSQLGGQLLEPGQTGYDTARVVWNGMIDRRPAQIARCRNAADVVGRGRPMPAPPDSRSPSTAADTMWLAMRSATAA